MKSKSLFRFLSPVVLILIFFLTASLRAQSAQTLSPKDLLALKMVSGATVSPDGKYVAYTVRVPRQPDDKPGSAYNELYVMSLKDGVVRPFITGKVQVYGVQWRPDSRAIGFLDKRGDDEFRQVYEIPVDGGEARRVTDVNANISKYVWHPSGKKIAYSAVEPPSKKDKFLKKKGYDFIFYEEEWKHINLYLYDLESKTGKQLTHDITVLDFKFDNQGKQLIARMTEKNLIDYHYMFTYLYLLNPETGEYTKVSKNKGKLGNFAVSPDGKRLAYSAALDEHDNAVSQAYVVSLTDPQSEAVNLTPDKYRGHVVWVGWKNNKTLLYRAAEGVENVLYQIDLKSKKRKKLLDSKEEKVIFGSPSFSKNRKTYVFTANSPDFPGELFSWRPGKHLKRLTITNPWLNDRRLGAQKVIRYQARDGLTVEGLLIYPVDYQKGKKYPLVVLVHGGPESHYSNGWVSRYSTPGQVLAGRGYFVFYPNYRASTGYGVDFARQGFGDPAGKEFDDIADGIKFLIDEGLADAERVGLGGGSYGGYAAAWFATYYTKLVKASCMFVGISDMISKKGTTDIPYEEMLAHAGKPIEETWEFSLQRSPIYYAHQSQTALLIYGGAADPRVHPSQSLELYRRFKMNDKTVRLVQYPGEGHGNRRQPGQIDVLYRVLDWYDWYLKEDHPVKGPMPPLDISEKYGLPLPE
ncbi:MAG: S9 family peptidase [Calditrichaeota bacterium]|nr:S9 family peptidase [Calditrichota bacterium]